LEIKYKLMDTDLEEIVESVRSKMSDRMRQSY
jgi:hypothetical protein